MSENTEKILCTFRLLTLSLPRKILWTHNEVKNLNTSVRVLADIFQVTDHARTKLLKFRAYSQPLPTCYKSLQPRFEKGTCHVIMIVGIVETHIYNIMETRTSGELTISIS